MCIDMEVYMDNARSTPIYPEVREAMEPYQGPKFGSPAAIYGKAMEANLAMEEGQETIGRALGCSRDEIVFTSGGTEANNLALMGTLRANGKKGRHLVVSAVEHPSVMKVAKHLENEGYEVSYVPVDNRGVVDLDALARAIRRDTVVVSVMMINDIVGTIQPIKEVGEVVKEKGEGAYLHVDAAEAFMKTKVDVDDMGIDLLSVSARKIHGPRGIGALYVRKGTKIEPILHGGMVVNDLRPALENVPGIAGFGKAVEICGSGMSDTWKHAARIQKRLHDKIKGRITDVQLNGPTLGKKRSPYNLNLTFDYVEGEAVTLMLDAEDICVATGSACASQVLKPNYVILALGKRAEDAHGSIRFTFSQYNTVDEVDYVMEKLPPVIEKLRELSPIKSKGD